MKKGIKIGLISAITLLSGPTLATETTSNSSATFVEKLCSYVPLACNVSTLGNGSGFEPPVPGDDKKDKK